MQTGENHVVSVLGSIFQGMVSHLVRPGSYSKISCKVGTDFRIDFCYFTVQSPYALSLSPPTEHSHVTPSKIDNYIHGLIVQVFGKRIILNGRYCGIAIYQHLPRGGGGGPFECTSDVAKVQKMSYKK